MFGSDWPVCLVAVSYAEWVSIIERFVESLSQSERERIWSGTAIEAYRL
jgi:L-fuconolactonase